MVAAYFAVEKDGKEDSAVYVCEVKEIVDKNKTPDPNEVRSVMRFVPPAITDRIVRQSGIFTVHPNVEENFAPDGMWKLVVPNAERRKMKRELFKLGFSRGALFPGLDGIAVDLTWEGSGIY